MCNTMENLKNKIERFIKKIGKFEEYKNLTTKEKIIFREKIILEYNQPIFSFILLIVESDKVFEDLQKTVESTTLSIFSSFSNIALRI